MPDRYDRQRDYDRGDRQGRPRDDRASGYSRASSGYGGYSDSRRSSYSRDYSRQGGDYSSQRGRSSADRQQRSTRPTSTSPGYSDYRRESRPPRDYQADAGRSASGSRYGRSSSASGYRSDSYRSTRYDRTGGSSAYRERGTGAASQRDYAQRSARARQASSYARANRPRDTYRASDPARRQSRRDLDGFAGDAFDPRANLQGGRSVRTSGMQGARGFRASGGSRPQYGFDIADAFQMGKFVLVGLVALLIIILIARAIYFASPSTYIVEGQEVSLARGTTYQGLLDSGELEATPGNLVAVDGEVLEERNGEAPKVFLNGERVEDLGAMISDQGDITAQNGDDAIEPYSAEQEITPIVTQLQDSNNFNFYNGVLHVVTDPGQEGIIETRTGETTGKTATVKVQDMKPRIIENLEPKLSSNNKLVALTFDDGPNPISSGSEEILAVMSKYHAKGTFFMLGTQVEEYPEEAKKIANAGHQVASHSYSHESKHYFNQTTEDDVRYQVQHAREVIQEATGVDPMYIRPPGGNVDAKAIMAADTLADGYIGWSIDTFDYELPGVDAIVNTVESEISPGAVILMHDGGGDREQTAKALDKLIPDLQEKGYTFVTVDELVQAILEERGGSQPAAQAPTGEQGANAGADQDDADQGAEDEEGSEE